MTQRTRDLATGLAAALLLASPLHAQHGPAAAFTGLPAAVTGLACAPTVATELPRTALRITGGQAASARRIFGKGDLITINAGTANKMEVGQEFFVRRPLTAQRKPPSRSKPAVMQTVGWVRVYAVDEDMSLVTVTHGCDTIEVGDYLEGFALPGVPPASQSREKPVRDDYARVMLGTDRRTHFGRGDYFVIDRGSRQRVTPGAQFVLYRDIRAPENFLFDLGEAVVVDVREDSATLLMTVSRDAVREGDFAALRPEP